MYKGDVGRIQVIKDPKSQKLGRIPCSRQSMQSYILT